MNLTSNFDFAIELGIEQVRAIFHLAFKSEDRFPHNIGPITQNLAAGQTAIINVTVLDDHDRPANLSFRDDKHVLFSIPFDLAVAIPTAPDPHLSQLTLHVTAEIPARLDSWVEGDGDVLGLTFDDVTPASVNIPQLDGLPSVDISNIGAAIHVKYDQIPHRYSQGVNYVNLYDGSRDAGLQPSFTGSPTEITPTLETQGTDKYLKVVVPIFVHGSMYGYTYESSGHLVFWRLVTSTDTTITVNMALEPADPALATQVNLDNMGPGHDQAVASLGPLAKNAIQGFGTITEPAYSDAAARQLVKDQVAAYLKPRKFPVYSPKSGDPKQPLSTPVGFLLVGDDVLSVLLNRRDSTVADFAPDDFLAGGQLALAVGRDKVIEKSDEGIQKAFPGVNKGGAEIHKPQGDATLHNCHGVPEDDGDHGQSPGHLWITGDATVHIPCWPDPDVTFEGPVFVPAHRQDTPQGCELVVEPHAGHFDVDESCCAVLLDILIPVVGWIMLAVVESTINSIGGEIAADTAGGEKQVIEPFPPVVNGIAEVTGCLTGLTISSAGFVFPGEVNIRRLGTSFQDLRQGHNLPVPDH